MGIRVVELAAADADRIVEADQFAASDVVEVDVTDAAADVDADRLSVAGVVIDAMAWNRRRYHRDWRGQPRF